MKIKNVSVWLFKRRYVRAGIALLLFLFSSDFLSSLCFPNLLSDCKDRLHQQLEKNRLLTNELRVALNED